MPRSPSKASKVSLYRLQAPEDGDLQGCIQAKYLERDEFHVEEVLVHGVASLLVSGVITNESPKWVSHIESLIGQRPNVYNDSSVAILLIPLESYVFALVWGVGRLAMDSALVDPGFGLRFALRRANPDQVKALTYHTMDTQARTARTTVPGGTDINAFGMEEIGEIVSRLVGEIPAAGLTAAKGGRDDYLTIQGSDSLVVPLARESVGLLDDLRFLHHTVEREAPVSGLEHFEHTHPLKPGDPATEPLKTSLAEALAAITTPGLALSWPAEWEQEHGEAHSYAVNMAGRSLGEVDELGLDVLLEPLAKYPLDGRLAALKRVQVLGLNSDGHPMSRGIAGHKWITFETDLDQQRYVFHQGRWFNIGGAYLEMLRTKMGRIFERRSTLVLPPWPIEKKKKGNLGRATEGNYNLYVAGKVDGYLCLDKKLVRSLQHPRGIEICDLLGPNDELIHVKHLEDSVSASHLFNQAIVSAEALRRQADTEALLRTIVEAESHGSRTLPADFRAHKVVLAFGGREATPKALMTFSQVTLARCATRLAELEIELEIVAIEDSSSILAPCHP